MHLPFFWKELIIWDKITTFFQTKKIIVKWLLRDVKFAYSTPSKVLSNQLKAEELYKHFASVRHNML